jgi:hypothetical protein
LKLFSAICPDNFTSLLDSRKHCELGHRPEAGSIAARAQSAPDKRKNFKQAAEKMLDKLDDIPELAYAEEAARLESPEYRSVGHRPSKDIIPAEAKLAAALNELSATDQAAVKEFLNVSAFTEMLYSIPVYLSY